MITELIKVRRILKETPQVNLTKMLKNVGLKRIDFQKLVEKEVIKKVGSTKGARWFWVGEKPTYDTVKEWLKKNDSEQSNQIEFELSDQASLVDVVFNNFNMTINITDDVTLSFVSKDKVILRRPNNEKVKDVEVTDAVKLQQILSLLT